MNYAQKGKIKMTIFEKAHELGELIKESPEMKAMDEAEEIQKNDSEAQKLLEEFNLQRMNLARDMQNGKIKQAEAIIKNNEAFAKMINQSENIKKYVEAKKEFDTMVAEVNKIINRYITGEDVSCTHNCNTCGGCH